VDRSLYFTSCESASCFCLRVIRAVNFRYIAVFIFHKALTLNKICMHQTNFISREQTEILLRRLFHKIFPLNIKFTTERNFSLSQFFVLKIVRNIQILNLSFRIIVDYQFNRIKHCHHTWTLHLQILTDTILKHRIIYRTLALGYST